jgi:hypothetical protein
MFISVKRLGLTALAGATLVALAGPAARAQRVPVAPMRVPVAPMRVPVGSAGFFGPGVMVTPPAQLFGQRIPANWFDPYGLSRTAAFNIRLYGSAMSQVPPYALGYNPYTPYYPPTPYYGGGYGSYSSMSTYGGYGAGAGAAGYGATPPSAPSGGPVPGPGNTQGESQPSPVEWPLGVRLLGSPEADRLRQRAESLIQQGEDPKVKQELQDVAKELQTLLREKNGRGVLPLAVYDQAANFLSRMRKDPASVAPAAVRAPAGSPGY